MIKNKYAIRYSFILKSLGLWLLALEFFFFYAILLVKNIHLVIVTIYAFK